MGQFLEDVPVVGGILQDLGMIKNTDAEEESKRAIEQAKIDAEAARDFYNQYDFSTPTAADLLENYGYRSAGGAMSEDYLMNLLGGGFDQYSGWGMSSAEDAQRAQDQEDALRLMEAYKAADTPIQDASVDQPDIEWEAWEDPYKDTAMGKAFGAKEATEGLLGGDFEGFGRYLSDVF